MLLISNILLELYNYIREGEKMKRTSIILTIASLVLISLILWALSTEIFGAVPGIPKIPIVLIILVGFALFIGIARIRSLLHKEPFEDELSKKMVTRASSLSYYFSIYLWLVIMYMSDQTELETQSLIGAGIAGMAVIFFLSWLGLKIYGMRNE